MACQFRLDVNLTWRDTLTTVSSAQLWMGKMLVNLPPFSVAIDAERVVRIKSKSQKNLKTNYFSLESKCVRERVRESEKARWRMRVD